jgi:hypothetical protein
MKFFPLTIYLLLFKFIQILPSDSKKACGNLALRPLGDINLQELILQAHTSVVFKGQLLQAVAVALLHIVQVCVVFPIQDPSPFPLLAFNQ